MARAVAGAGIEPPAVRHNAGRTGGSVVYSSAGFVEHDPLKRLIEAGRPLEFEFVGVDDVDALARAISQIEFFAVRIDEADVERLELNAGDGNGSHAPGLSCGRCAWAFTLCDRRDSGETQQGGKPHRYS